MHSNLIICDDHPLIISSLEKLINSNFKDVITSSCKSSDELKNKLKKDNQDYAILDLNLHEENLLNALEEIEQINPGLKIIIFSNYTDLVFNKQNQYRQIKGIISKSAEESEIVMALKQVFGGDVFFGNISHSTNKPDIFSNLQNLTNRELDIIKGIAQGKTNQMIGESLYISIETVKTHRKNIYKKLDIHTVNQLITLAINYGITQ